MQDLKLTCGKQRETGLELQGIKLGGTEIVLMAGPCAVESQSQVYEAAEKVKKAGGKVLRGGIFKPRSSPYSFQGLGVEGLDYLVQAARDHSLLSLTEVIDAHSLNQVAEKVDMIQIGARNMQNFELLKLAGRLHKPVVLKRGMAATIEEWLLAAEYIMAEGNAKVILCERGIRTFETATRNTLDLSSVAVAKGLTHLPVIVDPSHAAGKRALVPALAKAALGVGADGLLIEMHPEPEKARCDGAQSLSPEELTSLSREMSVLAASLKREFAGPLVEENLNSLRAEIDKIDDRIVELLAQRMGLSSKVGNHKPSDSVRDPGREREILQRLSRTAVKLQCPSSLIKAVYSHIFDQSIRNQLSVKQSSPGLSGK